jgi:type IV pilus biogenesis protein CpaD/CtpE
MHQVMIDFRNLLLAAACASLAGCGSSTNAPVPASPPASAKPDVVVTVDATRHACVVALANEANGSTIACGDVVSFVKQELRLPSGSICDIRTTPGGDAAQAAGVAAGLSGAGYRIKGK